MQTQSLCWRVTFETTSGLSPVAAAPPWVNRTRKSHAEQLLRPTGFCELLRFKIPKVRLDFRDPVSEFSFLIAWRISGW